MSEKESGQFPEENNLMEGATQERREQAIDFIFEQLLLQSEMVDQGVNGFIFKIDIRVLDPILREQLRENGVETETENAMKLLKIYREGQGKYEFLAQKKAYDVLETHSKELARVPKPLFYKDLQLGESTSQYLMERYGYTQKRAELLIMEYVQAEDLKTVLTREAKRLRNQQGQLDEATYVIDDVLARSSHYSAWLPEDAKTVFQFLRESGFEIDSSIVDRLEKSILQLHKNKIAHRDLHERNILVSTDENGYMQKNTADVWMIDFGSSREFTAQETKYQIYEKSTVPGALYPFDEELIERCAALKPRGWQKEEYARSEAETIRAVVERFRQDRGMVAKRNQWLERHGDKPVEASTVVPVLFHFFFKEDRDYGREQKWAQFLDYLITFIEHGKTSSNDVAEALGQLIQSGVPKFVETKIRSLKRGIKVIENRG